MNNIACLNNYIAIRNGNEVDQIRSCQLKPRSESALSTLRKMEALLKAKKCIYSDSLIKELATSIRDRFFQKSSKVSWIRRFFGRVAKKEREVDEVFGRILAHRESNLQARLPELPLLPPLFVRGVADFLSIEDLVRCSEVNRETHAAIPEGRLKIAKAQGLGYRGSDLKEALEYLKPFEFPLLYRKEFDLIKQTFRENVEEFVNVATLEELQRQISQIDQEIKETLLSKIMLYAIVFDSEIMSGVKLLQLALTCGGNPNHYPNHPADFLKISPTLTVRFRFNGNTPFLLLPCVYTEVKERSELTRLLLMWGADPSIQSRCGKQIMAHQLAAYHGYLEVLKLLIGKIDRRHIDHYSDQYMPGLHCACDRNHFESVKVLVEAGADVNLFLQGEHPKKGSPLFYVADRGDYVDIAAYLISKGANVNETRLGLQSPIFPAITINCLGLVKLFAPRVSDINRVSQVGKTPLYRACEDGRVEMVKVLLEQPRIDPNVPNTDGSLPLCIASEKGFTEIVSLLIEKGVGVNHLDRLRRSALYYATLENRIAVIRILQQSGASDRD